jgi:carboxyl-terminal processing protease
MSGPRIKNITDKLLILTILVAVFISGYRLGEKNTYQQPRTPSYNYTVKNLEEGNTRELDFGLFWEAWNSLEEKYVDKEKLDPTVLYYGAIKGMVAAAGDPYTFFLTPEENAESKRDLAGKFYGIGAELGLRNNNIVIVTPLKNSPAEKAGIRPGDIIIKVDGKDVTNWTLFEAISKIRGEKSTQVKLTLLREGQDEEIEISITRDEIDIPFVEISFEDDVAIVELSRFGDPTNSLWDGVVDDILARKSQGTLSGIVLDMRGNPGGLLQSAVYISSEFLSNGDTIVKQEFADQDPEVYTANRTGKLLGVPVVVLQNKGSASAAEIVAGALRDNIGAKIVGENSFGKGTVQAADELSKGAGIHITISKWVLPKGGWIHETGIAPDVAVENDLPDGFTLTRKSDKQLDEAIKILKPIP